MTGVKVSRLVRNTKPKKVTVTVGGADVAVELKAGLNADRDREISENFQ